MIFIMLLLLILLTIVFFAQTFFSITINTILNRFNKKNSDKLINNDLELPVSVIIAAKNEADNIASFLPKVLEQDYSNFEVILINDASTDNTKKCVEAMMQKYSNLRLINLSSSTGKKNALKNGIKKAVFPNLLFIDADCCPNTKNWIKIMVNTIQNKDIILGFGGFYPTNNLTNKFVIYDTYLIALQYFASAKIGKPYMGVGRNLLYNKQLWVKANGFSSHKDLLSGDDDLFISEVATIDNTDICINKDAHTMSVSAKKIMEYVRQKSRHITTANRYSLFAKIFTSFDIVTRIIFYLLSIILFFSEFWLYSIIIIAIRLFVLYITGYNTRKILNSKIEFHYFILFDIFAPIFYFIVFIYSRLRFKSNSW